MKYKSLLFMLPLLVMVTFTACGSAEEEEETVSSTAVVEATASVSVGESLAGNLVKTLSSGKTLATDNAPKSLIDLNNEGLNTASVTSLLNSFVMEGLRAKPSLPSKTVWTRDNVVNCTEGNITSRFLR